MGVELVKAKKKCCQDRPRCKKCPVVCKRLGSAGYYQRVTKRRWVVIEAPKKKALKAARAR